MSYLTQFPREYSPSPRIISAIEGRGFEDISYGNDVAPSWVFESDWISLFLFIHPEDPREREDESHPRFELYFYDRESGGLVNATFSLCTESLSELISVLDGETRIQIPTMGGDWVGRESPSGSRR